jgi:hypothetical protein
LGGNHPLAAAVNSASKEDRRQCHAGSAGADPGVHPSSLMTSSTCCLVVGVIWSGRVTALDTVAIDTPAFSATVRIVIPFFGPPRGLPIPRNT